MKRTVESGKTLLVDGPASVIVVSGDAEAFGFKVPHGHRIVIREGKRLPFVVEETATFDISLGENAKVDEVDGSTIPSSWVNAQEELLNIQKRPMVAMVLGAVDSGKTSFCTYLINKLLREKWKVAILDGDLGQSDIGPPCTIAYTFVMKPVTDMFNLKTKNAFFAGFTSPSVSTSKVINGLVTLKNEVLEQNPDFLIVNTDGWVEGEEAVSYKVQLVEKVNPDVVFCIQQKDELAPILEGLERFRMLIVESPSAIRQRSREKRRSLRELGYVKHLKNAKLRSFPLSWIKVEENELLEAVENRRNFRQERKICELLGMKPLHLSESQNKIYIVIGKGKWLDWGNIQKVEELTKKKIIVVRKGEEQGSLLALYNGKRKFLGIGILREIDYRRKTMKIYTPVSDKVSTVSVGKVKLDKNLKEIPLPTEENVSEDFRAFKELF